MKFTHSHIFNKKYLLLNCVIYRLTLVFLIQWTYFPEQHRNSCSQIFFKIVVLKIFKNFTRNICIGVFFNKVTGPQACNFIKKKPQHRCFCAKFLKFSITLHYSTNQVAASKNINCNTKFFERSSVSQGGKDHTRRGLFSQHFKN